MGGSRPDFVLRSSQGSLPVVAIFTDGWPYHASPAYNRIADDARKRQELRDGGAIVLGITARDVEHARNGTFDSPAWLNNDVIAALMSSTVTSGRRTWRPSGAARSTSCWPGSRARTSRATGCSRTGCPSCSPRAPRSSRWTRPPTWRREAALRLRAADRSPRPATRPPGPGGGAPDRSAASPGRQGTSWSGADRGSAGGRRPDRAAPRQDQAADSWREWLRISNALNLREQPTIITAVTGVTRRRGWRTTRSPDLGSDDLAGGTAARVAGRARPRHRAVRSGSSSSSSRGTRAAEPVPMPVVGYEAEDGIPIDFAWPDARIAVCLDLTPTTGVTWSRPAGACSPTTRTPSSQR